MDKERMRRLREELAATEAGQKSVPDALGVVTVAVPPVVQTASPATRSDSKETHDSIPLKRSRSEKSVSIAVPPVQPSGTPVSLIPSLENLKISTPITLASVLFTLSHAHRLAAEYASGLDAEVRGYKDRAKDLYNKNNEANKVIKQERAALVRKNEEIEKGKNEVLRLTQELEAGKQKVAEYDALFQRYSELESSAKAKDLEMQRMQGEIRKLEIGSLQSYESGYNEALKHVKHLHPDEDLSVYGPFHEIIGGKLMDPGALNDVGGAASQSKAEVSRSTSGVSKG